MAAKKKYRNFPRDTLEEALAVPQKIMDEMAGKPFKRLLLAEALGTKPSSSNFRYLLSSSYQYGLTDGTEKASEIKLTDLGRDATQSADPSKRVAALRQAAITPDVFGRFYRDYSDKKIPSPEMLGKILVAEYGVPEELANECARLLLENGRFAGIIRDIGVHRTFCWTSLLLRKKPSVLTRGHSRKNRRRTSRKAISNINHPRPKLWDVNLPKRKNLDQYSSAMARTRNRSKSCRSFSVLSRSHTRLLLRKQT
jgi:hypothetical protein